jgi:hypothetical protein
MLKIKNPKIIERRFSWNILARTFLSKLENIFSPNLLYIPYGY